MFLVRIKQLIKRTSCLYNVSLKVYHNLYHNAIIPTVVLVQLAIFAFFLSKKILFGQTSQWSVMSAHKNLPLVVMLVFSDVHFDPRVERGAKALARNGYFVRVLYTDLFGSGPDRFPPDWGEQISLRSLPGYLVFFRAVMQERPLVYHCHDLSTCIIGLTAAAKNGAYCFCDFHEWISENVSWDFSQKRYIPHPLFKRQIYRVAERQVMKWATEVITVCDSIAEALQFAYRTQRKIHVIRNIPPVENTYEKKDTDLRKMIGVDGEKFILLYQGGVGPSRYLEPIIKAMADVPNGIFIIRGPGISSYRKEYEKLAHSFGIRERIFCLDPVPSNRVVIEAAGADAGIWTLQNLCKNFRFALPNKIFEYLAAGLPVLVADYPEARKLVDGYGVGLCFDPDSPKSIAEAINELIGNAELTRRCKENIPRALNDNNVEKEWNKLINIYEKIR